MTAAPTLAEEVALARRAARDCELVLALAAGVPLARHEAEEARDKLRALAGAQNGQGALCPPRLYSALSASFAQPR